MVIDRPRFYFTANKIKRWLLIIALVSFVLSLVAYALAPNNVEATASFVGVTILAIVAYLILWFIT